MSGHLTDNSKIVGNQPDICYGDQHILFCSQILFGGTSAGGIGVLANIDHVQRLTYPARVRGYNDGGWFTLFPNYGEGEGLDGINGLPSFYKTFVKVKTEVHILRGVTSKRLCARGALLCRYFPTNSRAYCCCLELWFPIA